MIRTLFIFLIFFFSVPVFSHGKCTNNGEKEVSIKITYKVAVQGHINKLRLKMVIPHTIQDKQLIKNLSFSIDPDSTYTIGSNSYASFSFINVEKDFKLTVKSRIIIYNIIKNSSDTSKSDLSKYLVAERNIEVDSPKIIALAQTLKQQYDIQTVMKTFQYVTDHISYEKNKAVGAQKVLELGVGKCMDYSDLFVALLRANNIPAKSIFGIVIDEVTDNPLHAWPEAYLKKQGWVRFDPTTGNSEIIPDGKNYKMRIDNSYVTLSEGRNDPELNTDLYRYSYSRSPDSSVKINVSFNIAGE